MQVTSLKHHKKVVTQISSFSNRRVYSRQRMSIPAKKLNGNLVEAQRLLRDNPGGAIENLARFLNLAKVSQESDMCSFYSHAIAQSLITGVPHIIQDTGQENKVRQKSCEINPNAKIPKGKKPPSPLVFLLKGKTLVEAFDNDTDTHAQGKLASANYEKVFGVKKTLVFRELEDVLNSLSKSSLGTVTILHLIPKDGKDKSSHLTVLVKWSKNSIFNIDRPRFLRKDGLFAYDVISANNGELISEEDSFTNNYVFYLSILSKKVSPKLLTYPKRFGWF